MQNLYVHVIIIACTQKAIITMGHIIVGYAYNNRAEFEAHARSGRNPAHLEDFMTEILHS